MASRRWLFYELKSDELGLELVVPKISGVWVTVEGLHQMANRVFEG